MTPLGIVLRPIRSGDGPALKELIDDVDAEADFMLREAGDPPDWLADPEAGLARLIAEGSIFFLAVADGIPIGSIGVMRGRNRRNRGVGTIGLGLRRAWWGHGVGNALLLRAEAWSRRRGLHRLELTVQTGNARAIALYRRRGFVEEGVRRAVFRHQDQWRDEMVMALLLRRSPKPHPPLVLPKGDPPAGEGAVQVRRIVPDDAAAFAQFNLRLLRETPFLMRSPGEGLRTAPEAREMIADRALRDEPTFVAVTNGIPEQRVVGVLGLHGSDKPNTGGEVHLGMGVLRDYWGAGVAGQLMATAENWVRDRGGHRIALSVFSHNARGLQFYHRCGFVHEATNRFYSFRRGRAVDLIQMAKLL